MTHVAITGASSGIGEALVREYVQNGASVTLVARRKELLDKICVECGGKTLVIPSDLGNMQTCTQWIVQAEQVHGPIDILINNAGVQIVGTTWETDPDKADELIRVDLMSPLRITRAILPAMVARKSGVIVNIASMAGIAPTPGMTWYNAAKAGLAAASESLRGELRGSGVHVLTVYPGPVDTDMARAAYQALPQSAAVTMLPKGTPTELAQRIRHAVEDRASRLIYPPAYALARHFPAPTRWIMDRFTPAPVRKG